MFDRIALLSLVCRNAPMSQRFISSNTASIVKIHRSVYARRYPTLVVLPNGSTININYHEPRRIIKLPLDLSLLSEAERKARLEKRKPKRVIQIEDEVDDSFNARKYIKFIKK
ncbi:39S ribosomal protein L55, mitochondrial [Toxorhynchites rutilus septentrionalis]|uniref:39S ribosomal protein L55, mitochondrial n=1 Tax=Toxorhynchites rutilus septentrionalis TaxID=329112 RepID=UPI00247A9DA4|nr:39S ribosomal protein L55, mitochondrial [Toxorhynchites rutilus septentrionalis]